MTRHPFYLVDAFCQKRFRGNQAAIILAQSPISDEEKQSLGAEFNLSETAFPEPVNGDYKCASRFGLRWFTPTTEVPLCGHATLATAHVLFYEVGNINETLTFETKSGDLVVSKGHYGGIDMDFPQYELVSISWADTDNKYGDYFTETTAPNFLTNVIRCLVPEELNIEGVVYAPKAKKLIVVIDSETTKFELGNLFAEYKQMIEIHPEGDWIRGVIVTLAPRNSIKQGFGSVNGQPYDYVCRYFAPWAGIDEDPATGSAQCAVAPFWSKILNKKELLAFQSYPKRGADFKLSLPSKERIFIQGEAVTVVSGVANL